MIRRLLQRLLKEVDEVSGMEALFTEDEAAYARDTALLAAYRWSRRRPADVGRQATVSAQITDTVTWLEASGWAGTDRGQLQCYALWLLEMRDRYERVRVS